MVKNCQTILIGHDPKAINFRIEIFSMFTYLEGRMFCGNIYMYIYIHIYIGADPVKRLAKLALEALINDMTGEGKPYISW